jgi:hypothetical protein
MKQIRLMIAAAVCGVALMFIANANAQGVKQGVVTVVRMSGTANYTADGTTWKPLLLGAVLQPGSVIKTDPDSTVDIVLGQKAAAVSQGGGVGINNAGAYAAGLPPTSANFTAAVQQNVIRIMAGTELAVDKLTFSDTGAETTSDTELDLKSGKIFGNVKKISAMSKYEIKTPTGVAGIRGTSFAMGSDGSVICYSGSVVVSFNGPNGLVVQTLNPGDQYNPATGVVTSLVPQGTSPADWAAANTPANTLSEATTENVSYQGNTTKVFISP